MIDIMESLIANNEGGSREIMVELDQGIVVNHSNGTVYESVIGDEKG